MYSCESGCFYVGVFFGGGGVDNPIERHIVELRFSALGPDNFASKTGVWLIPKVQSIDYFLGLLQFPPCLPFPVGKDITKSHIHYIVPQLLGLGWVNHQIRHLCTLRSPNLCL